jgi:PAS domain S-box-containing protein
LRLYRLTIAAGLAISVGIAALGGGILWADRAERLATAERQSLDLARTLGEHAARTFGVVDILLDQVAERLDAMHNAGTLKPETIQDLFRRYETRLPQVSGFGMLDADGRAFGSALPGFRPGTDFSDRNYFRVPAAGSAALFVSEPFISRITGKPVLTVSRRVGAPDGALVGVVTAVVDQGYFRSVFDASGRYGGELIALVSERGNVLAASSSLAARLERDPFGSAANGADGFLGLDLSPQTAGVAGFPMRIAVADDRTDELAQWRVAAWRIGGAAAVLIATILGLTLALARVGRNEWRVRHELAASHERLNLAIEGYAVGLWDWNIETGEVYRSPRMLEILGATSRLQRADSLEEVHPDDRERVRKVLMSHLRNRTPYDVESRVRRADGRYIWVHARAQAVWDASGRAVRMAGSTEDITARKSAELALEESRRRLTSLTAELGEAVEAERVARAELARSVERFELAVEASSAGIWDWDAGSNRLFASARLREILGIGEDGDLKMDDFIARIHPDDRERVHGMIHAMFKQRLAFSAEYRSWRDDGAMVWIQGRARARFDEFGRAVRVTGSSEDVTDRKTMDLALREQRAQLEAQAAELQEAYRLSDRERLRAEAANRSKSDFLATMSHEIRTPLNAILGFSEVIRDATMGTGKESLYREYAAHIHEGGGHLLSLVNDILDLSKIEAGRMELHRRWVPIDDLLDECCRLVAGMAQGHRTAMAPATVPAGCRLWADERAARQMVVNLLANAIKFSPPGSTVGVDVKCGDEGVEIAVSDSGPGMTEAEILVALTPFGQIDHALGRASKGTGLGLPLVKSMAELHGGSMTIESAKGHGTVVHLRFPPGPAEGAPAA